MRKAHKALGEGDRRVLDSPLYSETNNTSRGRPWQQPKRRVIGKKKARDTKRDKQGTAE